MDSKMDLRNTFIWVLVCYYMGVSGQSLSDTLTVVPQNGTTLDLRNVPNRFIKVALTHPFGANSDVSFSVVAPLNHGIVIVIRTMRLRQGVPVIGPSQCYEYVQFESIDSTGKTHSAFACGSITDESFELIGHRSFVAGPNEKVTISVHFSNEIWRQNSNSNDHPPEGNGSLNSTFILDITAYSDCTSRKLETEQEFACSPTMCISWFLHCDGNYNCPVGNDRAIPQDELDCQLQKRETQPPPSSTSKPRMPFDISSSYWPWNWSVNLKGAKTTTTTTTTTTEKPLGGTLVVNVFEHPHNRGGGDSYVTWWDSQMPIITVIVVFLAISCLLFGMCSFLAKWNTRQHTSPPPEDTGVSRRQDLGVPNHYSIPAPEGRIYFYPECDNRAYCPTPPPPPYSADQSGSPSQELPPPSYNTLFRKSPSSLYASDTAGNVPVAHTISVPPVYDPAAMK